MNKHRYLSISALVTAAALTTLSAGCKHEDALPGGTTANLAGVNMSLQASGDAAKIELVIKRVSCDKEPIQTPYTFVEIIDVSGASDAGHSIHDKFVVLDPGCYDIVLLPLQADGTPSASCAPAGQQGVVVVDGYTTEIGFVEECKGKDKGGLDIYTIFNTPPNIEDGVYTPDKFVAHCDTQKICVTFRDPDGDPIELAWSQVGGVTLQSGPTVVPGSHTYDASTGLTSECVTLQHAGPGLVSIEVLAFDMMLDPSGKMIRIEQFLKDHGIQGTSHDAMVLLSHGENAVNCPCSPHPEVCDGVDNNCNGTADEGLACACIPGNTRYCYGGPAGTAGVGVCRSGGEPCLPSGLAYGACQGAVLPSIETCNGLDDDCNGAVDNGFPTACSSTPCSNVGAIQACNYTGPAGTVGVGLCKAAKQICQSNHQWSPCAGQVLPSPDSCNGKDDNCDAQVDEGMACMCDPADTSAKPCPYSGPPGALGKGQCKAGTRTCQQDGTWNACSGEVLPTAEIPNNGKDDDCDGVPDNICVPTPEICNNKDDNCNGLIDDGLGTQTCGVGACQVTVPSCANGQAQTCMPKAPAASETCGNLIDDDCNGAIDESPSCGGPGGSCLAGCVGGVPDGVCADAENSLNCAQDCACGDGQCSGSETPTSCPVDCAFSSDVSGFCGDGLCEPWEVNTSTKTLLCVQDCNLAPGSEPPGTTCGDGTCSTAESSAKCPADCGNATTYINGNGVCEKGEHRLTSVDCPGSLAAGTFLDAACQGYALVETYASSNGGVTTHTVTTCSESCGAAPWKLLSPTSISTGVLNGATLLKPDCTTCVIANAPTNYRVEDSVYYGDGWLHIPSGISYAMALNPNDCGTYAVRYDNTFGYYAVPVEWEKVSDKDCSTGGCQVYDCAGNVIPQSFGTVGVWKPAYASWSLLAEYCQ